MTIEITARQLLALQRVVRSMNLVGARISVTPDDVLTESEMTNLEYRLRAPEAPEVEIEVAS